MQIFRAKADKDYFEPPSGAVLSQVGDKQNRSLFLNPQVCFAGGTGCCKAPDRQTKKTKSPSIFLMQGSGKWPFRYFCIEFLIFCVEFLIVGNAARC